MESWPNLIGSLYGLFGGVMMLIQQRNLKEAQLKYNDDDKDNVDSDGDRTGTHYEEESHSESATSDKDNEEWEVHRIPTIV